MGNAPILVRMSIMNPNTNKDLYAVAGLVDQANPEIRPLAEVERLYIEMVISFCGGNIPRAATLLKVSPSTVYRKKAAWDKQSQTRD